MSTSPLAKVSPDARIGTGVSIGDFTVVYGNVSLGDGTTIESHCAIGLPTPLSGGKPLVIGDGAVIRSHSVLYEGSSFGPGLRTGHRATVRERVSAGAGLQIGTNADFQGDSVFGQYVRTHSGVFVAKGARIGDFAWLFPHSCLLNDPHPPSDLCQEGVTIDEYAAVGASSCVLAGVRVGARSLVAAGSLVNRDVEPDTLVAGVPARKRGPTSKVLLRDGSGRPAYPWMNHFHRGYPPATVEEWKRRFGRSD